MPDAAFQDFRLQVCVVWLAGSCDIMGSKKIVKSLLNSHTASVSRKKEVIFSILQNNLRSSETFQIRVQKGFDTIVSAIA